MPEYGVEEGVGWYWVGDLTFTLDGHTIAPHPIHSKAVAAIGGNRFYGSFSLISNNGACLHGDQVIDANPTKTDHTEPQYFAWLGEQFSRPEVLLLLLNTKAIVLEINQTNTPCSSDRCRKAILNMVANVTYGKAYFIARMGAYQRYDSQPPKVGLTYSEAKSIAKKKTTVALTGAAAIHKVPDAMTV